MSGVMVGPFEGAASEWDTFVRAQPNWTHFQLHGWRDVIRKVFGHECVYLAARDASTNEIVAVLPSVRVRSIVFGHFLVSMPFLNYGGPLGNEVGVRALVASVEALAAKKGIGLVELRSRTALPIDLPVSHRKLTVVLDLPPDSEVLWKALPAKVRSQIKRPKKDGVEIRCGADQVGPFYAVFARHMRDLGTPAQSRAFFDTMLEVFPNDVHIAVAYHANQPIACGWGFLWNGEFEITWASALRSHKAMSPNMLVYWELMERTTAAGARLFNFGRCTKDSGTYRFKMQWGGREEVLWWYQHAANAAGEHGATVSTPSPDQGVFALATRVWQKIPVPVATLLGPRIVRYIP
jgi:FemAB-related protein (PEP-CTERM system-associated)